MEVEKYISDLNISLLANTHIALKEDDHEDAFIKSTMFVLNLCKPLVCNEFYFLLKKDVDFNGLSKKNEIISRGIFNNKKYYKYIFDIKEYDNVCKKILKSIYYLDGYESMFCSKHLYVSICSDPINVDLYYGDDKESIDKIHKHFFLD